MTTRIRRYANFSVLVLLIVIVLMAIMITLARLLLPIAADHRGWFEDQLSQAIGQRVEFDDLHVRLEGINPTVRFDHLRLFPKGATEPIFKFPQASVSLDVAASLLYGSPRIKSLSLYGPAMHFIREMDGKIHLVGIESQGDLDLADVLESTGDLSLRLNFTQVRFEDKTLAVDYAFADVEVSFVARGGHYGASIQGRPLFGLGEGFKAALRFEGPLSEPQKWKAEAYLRLDGIDAARFPWQKLPDVTVDQGRVSLESWGEWDSGRVSELSGALEAQGLEAVFQDYLQPGLRVSRYFDFTTQFLWEADESQSTLKLTTLDERSDGPGPLRDLELAFDAREDAKAPVRGHLGAADAEWFAPLASVYLKRASPQMGRLLAAVVSGGLADLSFYAGPADEQGRAYGVSGTIANLKVLAGDGLPGIELGAATLLANHQAGRITLDDTPMRLTGIGALPDALTIDEASANIQWLKRGDAYELRVPELALRNPDWEINGKAEFDVGGGPVVARMDIGLADLDLSTLARYLPREKINPKLASWLTDALQSGRIEHGRVQLSGPLDQFPYRNGGGRLKVELPVRNAQVNYKSGWPIVKDLDADIVVEGTGLIGQIKRARLFKSDVKSGVVSIANLYEPILGLETKSLGSLADILAYLRDADLIKPDNRHLSQLVAAGQGTLDLRLNIPLLKSLGLKTMIGGVLSTEDADLDFPTIGQKFGDLRATIAFDRSGAEARGARVSWRGQPMDLSVSRVKGDRTIIELRGVLPTRTLLQGINHSIFSAVTGKSPWHGRLLLPAFGEQGQGQALELTLASLLKGVDIGLPAPFRKQASQSLPLSLQMRFRRGDDSPLWLRYGDLLTAAIGFQPETRKPERMGIALNQGLASLPKAGIGISGSIDRWRYEEWRPFLWPENNTQTSKSSSSGDLVAREIDLRVDDAKFRGFSIAQLGVQVKRVGERWLGTLNAPAIKGKIDAPPALLPGATLKLDLEWLDLDPAVAREADPASTVRASTASLDPRSLPDIELRSAGLKFTERLFRNLFLQTKHHRDGVSFEHFDLDATSLELRTHGSWLNSSGAWQTRLSGKAQSNDLGRALRILEITDRISEGKAQLKFDLNWQGAPQEFALNKVAATGQILIKNGRMSEIDPGVARLLGLLNLEGTLLRRLSFDFKDLLGTGFTFDRVEGALRLEQANLYTDHLKLEAPAADANINGRVGLVAKDFDLDILVNPKLTSGLPIVGALLGGPGVGAVIFVTDKLLTELGAGIDRVVGILYRVTGPWKDPVVDRSASPSLGSP